MVVLATPSRVIARIAASVNCRRRSADGIRAIRVPFGPRAGRAAVPGRPPRRRQLL
ncbi:hypothetical protein GCM10010336_18160 [Streptomyces goshikiensis]|nr:hypothetical protein GCM10010336_18160 [Streptomyces goshikiensis]